MIAAEPPGPVGVPHAVRVIAADRPVRPVWRNELDGLTFEVGAGAGRCFVKWSPPGGPDLAVEAERLHWAAEYTPVPAVLEHGADADGSWLATAPLAGHSAVDPRWLADPEPAVRAVGAGLRALHDALPVATCPFSWSATEQVVSARRRAGVLDPLRWHSDHRHLDVPGAFARLDRPPPVDRLVVCHGDACAPNTIVADDGGWSGHVDLGSLGVGDRWADLAVATWSTVWNYGPGWESPLLEAYGIEPDPVRIAYYRLLWDLGP